MIGIAPAWTDPAADPIRDLRAAVAEFMREYGWRPRLVFQADALRGLVASRAFRDWMGATSWPMTLDGILTATGCFCHVDRVGVLAPASDHVRPDPRLPALTLDTGAGLVWLLPDGEA